MKEVEIKIKGKIDENWTDWFGGFTITYNRQNETILRGTTRDQSQLRGLLVKIADLNLELLSVTTRTNQKHENQKRGW